VLYLTFGGGGEAEIDGALSASIEALASYPDLHLAVASAPLHRDRNGVLSTLRGSRVTPVNYYPMAELYPAFDAALSAAGYNTVMELLHHGVPGAYFPLARQVDDQEARAQRIQDAG